MKTQLTFVILLLALSFSLLAQSPEPENIPDVVEDSESQQTPDVITDLVPDEDALPAQAYKPPVAPEPMPPREKALFQSAFDGNLADVQVQIAKGASVNYSDKEQRTALLLAANNGHTAVVEFLYGKGADINVIDHGGMTALMYTAKRSFNETAAFLLNHGAEVNVQTRKKGITALMIAAVADNVELVRMLLDHGADANLTDIFGRTAKVLAQKKGNSAVVDMLSNPPEPEGES